MLLMKIKLNPKISLNKNKIEVEDKYKIVIRNNQLNFQVFKKLKKSNILIKMLDNNFSLQKGINNNNLNN